MKGKNRKNVFRIIITRGLYRGVEQVRILIHVS